MHTCNIKAPLLLIHGEADDNTGTFPTRPERLYQAICRDGGTARLVMLPSEAHAYRVLETNEHVLYRDGMEVTAKVTHRVLAVTNLA